MKTRLAPGEFGFKALFKRQDGSWQMTKGYFFSVEELTKYLRGAMDNKEKLPDFKWPIREHEELTGGLYVPSKEELEEDEE